jgi:hypothetical protein
VFEVVVRLVRARRDGAAFPAQTAVSTHIFHSAAYSGTKPTAGKRNMTDTSFGQGVVKATALVYVRRPAEPPEFANPQREQELVMLQAPPQLPDLSVDFLTWLNAELRRHIDGPKEPEETEDENPGFVNRLKAYLTRG